MSAAQVTSPPPPPTFGFAYVLRSSSPSSFCLSSSSPHGRAANLPVFSFFGARPLLLYASLFFPLFLSHTKIFVGRPPPREKGGGKKDEGNLCDLFFSKVCARAWVRGKHSKFDCFENERGWKQKSNSKICSSLAVGTIRTVRTLSKIHI